MHEEFGQTNRTVSDSEIIRKAISISRVQFPSTRNKTYSKEQSREENLSNDRTFKNSIDVPYWPSNIPGYT